MPLPWFRRRKPDATAPETAATPAPKAPEPTNTASPPAGPAADSDDAAKKRRRGTRGGRNRKRKTTSGATAAATVATAPAAEKKKAPERKQPERKQPERKQRAAAPRRRQAPKRAPLPKAKRELLVSVDAGEKRVAVLEDDKVAEVYLERPERRSIAGAVYLGVVDNVLPGMEAAFIEIGLEKNGFLYVDEIIAPELEGRRGARKIQDLIQRGQTVLVQAVKDPMKTKGARLTTEISLPGRFVVYVPHGEGLGVSRRLDDDERTRLKAILKECSPKKGGVIVRTAAEGASAEDIERDLDFLQRLWKSIEARAKESTAPALIYQEAELPLRVVRDLFTGDFERLLVDHDRTYKRIVGYLKKTSPHMAERVVRYKEREPLMEAFGVEQEIKSTLSRRVDLPSGGYLVFDYAEAFTVIDVNTGRFVGSRSRNSAGRLEDTITKNNLEAVKEVVRQLRLRDIGGIIVIDFIDMANPKNRAAVEEALRSELERDRTKTYVVEISPLGLVEMTRQNVTDGPREVMTKKCPTCGGDGIVVSEHTAAVDVERRLRALVTPGSRAKAFKVEVSSRIAALVAGPAGARLRELEETTKRQFFLVGKDDEHLDHFRVLAQGTLEKVTPDLPVSVGQELELKLGEVGLYDARAGVAKIDGVDVYVGDAAKLVGKKVKARITLVSEGMAWAELLSPVERVRDPLTAEAEAEKPTRARRAAKSTSKADAPAAVVEPEPDPVDEEPEPEPEAEPAAEAPKKKTRRGTRGGRNRKKKATAAAPAGAAQDGAEPEAEPAPAAENGEGPVIHVPDRGLGAEDDGDGAAAAPRKRTRRGTRGGRNRSKKTAAAAATAAPEQEQGSDENGDEAWNYTPMSEWGLDGE
ncbi:MAG TPA: Rne/Rng family ribonuclease [Gaiellaceae bacterium]|nr:Rne/Rng family ribonuclease [Gaiellaceae bacterium]